MVKRFFKIAGKTREKQVQNFGSLSTERVLQVNFRTRGHQGVHNGRKYSVRGLCAC